jgi:hypothetical protein
VMGATKFALALRGIDGASRPAARPSAGNRRTGATALLNGEVDVWASSIIASARELEQAGIRYKIIKAANYGIHVPGIVYFASEATIRDRPDVVRKRQAPSLPDGGAFMKTMP